jgi:hypothetical protein
MLLDAGASVIVKRISWTLREGLDLDSDGKGPNLARIEWEALQDKWEIENVEESPALPQGAEGIVVWRNDQYRIEATVTGTPAGTVGDMLPTYGKLGSLIPDFEIEGSGMRGSVDYKLSHCILGPISIKGMDSFEAGLTTHRVHRTFRQRDLTSPVWLTEWYLNAYRSRSFVYPRVVQRELKEEYRKKRDFLGVDTTFRGQDIGSSSPCAFVETSDVNFIVEPVPDVFGPSWSKCLGIEYREELGGIPDADVRDAVAEIVSFVMGRPLIHVGYTSFDKRGMPIEQVAVNPLEDILHISRRAEQPPIDIDKGRPTDAFETVLRELVPRYLERRSVLNLNNALWGYWLSERSPLGANLPELATSTEILKNAWFESAGSKSRGVYMPKKEFTELLADELAAVEAKLLGVEYGDRMSRRIRNAFNMGVNESLEFFFEEIGLPVGEVEWAAIAARNPMAHGSSELFDASKYDEMLHATFAYRTLFNRIILKLLDYSGTYVDRSVEGWPERALDEPMAGST